jgi:hypothetical protein
MPDPHATIFDEKRVGRLSWPYGLCLCSQDLGHEWRR